MADPRTLQEAWEELATTLAEYQPDKPLDSGLPARLLRLLLWPLGPQAADHNAGLLLDLAVVRWNTPRAAEGYYAVVERTVAALIAAVRSETPLAGVSPTTAQGEGVTGTAEGHTAGPVTPARVYMEDGMPVAWVADPAPGGVVCAVADAAKPDGLCGMPVEDVPCTVHYPGADDE